MPRTRKSVAPTKRLTKSEEAWMSVGIILSGFFVAVVFMGLGKFVLDTHFGIAKLKSESTFVNQRVDSEQQDRRTLDRKVFSLEMATAGQKRDLDYVKNKQDRDDRFDIDQIKRIGTLDRRLDKVETDNEYIQSRQRVDNTWDMGQMNKMNDIRFRLDKVEAFIAKMKALCTRQGQSDCL